MNRLRGRLPAVVGNSLWSAWGEAGRVVTQAVLLLVVARAVGPSGFGRFAAATTLLQLAGPVVWFGAYNLLVQRVATGTAALSVACSTALTTVGLAGPLGIVLLGFTVRPLLLPDLGWTNFLILGAAELVFAGFVETLAVAGWAAEELRRSAVVRWVAGTCRVAGAGVFVLAGEPSDERLLFVIYASTTALGAALGILLLRRWYDLHLTVRVPDRHQLRLGLSFAVGGAAFMLQDNGDKPLLLRLGGAEAAGTYIAGYRVVILALIPVRAVLSASYAGFFRSGVTGLHESAALARRRLVPAGAYAALAAIVMLLFAPTIARIFGDGFEESADVIRMLSALPLIRAAYAFVADALTGAGMHAARVRLMVGSTALNLGLNVVLIPRYSWQGAAFATLVAESVLCASIWLLLARRLRTRGTGLRKQASDATPVVAVGQDDPVA